VPGLALGDCSGAGVYGKWIIYLGLPWEVVGGGVLNSTCMSIIPLGHGFMAELLLDVLHVLLSFIQSMMVRP